MTEGIAIYLAIGSAILLGGCMWDRSIPRGAGNWLTAALLVFLWPLWLLIVLKERLS